MKKLKGRNALLDKAMSLALKRTAMRIFFGGETLEETMKRCDQLLSGGMGIIVDYAPPEESSKADMDPNIVKSYYARIADMYKQTIEGCEKLHGKYPEGSVAIAIKISTIADYDTLKRLSAELTQKKVIDKDPRYADLYIQFRRISKKLRTS
jgi:hypothetical protein